MARTLAEGTDITQAPLIPAAALAVGGYARVRTVAGHDPTAAVPAARRPGHHADRGPAERVQQLTQAAADRERVPGRLGQAGLDRDAGADRRSAGRFHLGEPGGVQH